MRPVANLILNGSSAPPENTKVNERRLVAIILLISIAYTLTTLLRRYLQNMGVSIFVVRLNPNVQPSDIVFFGWDCTLPIGFNL